jgi:hypothetical protein
VAGIGRIIAGILIILILGLPLLAFGLLAVLVGTAFFGGIGFAAGLIFLIPGLLFFLLGIWLVISGFGARKRAQQPPPMMYQQGMPPPRQM